MLNRTMNIEKIFLVKDISSAFNKLKFWDNGLLKAFIMFKRTCFDRSDVMIIEYIFPIQFIFLNLLSVENRENFQLLNFYRIKFLCYWQKYDSNFYFYFKNVFLDMLI